VRFGLGGREYEYDSTLTVGEAMVMQDKAGIGVNEIDEALRKGNPYAIAAWMFILMRRAGTVISWQDMQELDIRTYAVIPDPLAEPSEEDADNTGAAPDPTRAGMSQSTDTAATSSP